MKKIITVSMVALLLVTSLFTQDFIKSVEAASSWGEDWTTMGGDQQRSRYVSDSDLKPPIMFKAKLRLGWSTSQPIAVGDFIYHIASVPNRNNTFGLSPGTYFYKIPADFRFFKPTDSEVTIANELIRKGAQVTYLGAPGESYGSPTYSPENNGFYLAYKSYIAFVGEDLTGTSRYANLNAQIVGAPTVFRNDLMATGTGWGSGSQGGNIQLIKGIARGTTFTKTVYRLSAENNAEVAATLAQVPNTLDFGVGVNFRSDSDRGPFRRYRVTDHGFGQNATLSSPWSRSYMADIGIAASTVYDDGSFFFADKSGTAYRLRASDGREEWKTNMRNTIGSVTLINNSPSVDSTNVYIPIRRPGKVAALDKNTGRVKWYANTAKDKNGSRLDNLTTGEDVANDITSWRTADGRNLIFYGDTAGQLSFLTNNGTRSNVAIDHTNGSLTRSSIKATSNSEVPADWQVQGQGLATEPMLAKKHFVFGVNTSSSHGELWFYSVGIADDMYVKSVQGGNYKENQTVLTKVRVGSTDVGAGKRVPVVRFYVDGVLKESRRIDLMPNEEQDIYFMWKTDRRTNNGKITVTINYNPHEFNEVDYSNNIKEANYTAGVGPQYDICLPSENKNKAVVKTETHTDYEGNTYTVYYYEYLVLTIDEPTPNKLRAGYGFKFEPVAVYIDETNTFSGPSRAKSKFPAAVNYVPDTVNMNKKSTTNSGQTEVSTWQLPLIYVEKYSGNLFYNKNDVKRDIDDALVNTSGERKWYTDFKTKDGAYIFKTTADQAGKNNLSACYTAYVDVKGTPFDDYARRSVSPDTPFLDAENVGFNWDGEETILEDVVGFYYNSNPNSSHYSTYFLNPEIVKDVQETDIENLSKEEAYDFLHSYDFD